MDRFLMKLSMEALSPAEETQMIARFLTEEPLAELSSVCQKEEIRALQEACKEVYLHPELVQYLVRIVQETRVNSKIASGVTLYFSESTFSSLIGAFRRKADYKNVS